MEELLGLDHDYFPEPSNEQKVVSLFCTLDEIIGKLWNFASYSLDISQSDYAWHPKQKEPPPDVSIKD